jgi:SAM-dependent methyltransferase
MAEMNAAEAYQAYLVPNVFGPWAELVIKAASLQPGERVLDVACGSGTAARSAAAAIGPRGAVIGVDLDEAMLAVARNVTVAEGSAAITWQHADAMNLPFPAASFDAVLCFEGIQFMPDRTRALSGFRRLLKPSGRLIGTIWGPLRENAGYQAIAEGLARFVSPDAARFPPFALDDAAVVRGLLADAGFTRISVEPRTIMRPAPSAATFIDWVASGAPTIRHKVAQLAEKDRAAFVAFVGERLEPFRRNDMLELPMMRHVLEAAVP